MSMFSALGAVEDTVVASQRPAANPARSLAEDPAYLAFLRAIGAEDTEDVEQTNLSADRLRRQAALRLPEIAEAGQISREGVSAGFEDRGLYRSGQHEVALARQRAAEARQVGAVQSGVTEGTSDLEARLARQRAARTRRKAEAGLSTSGSLASEV